MSGLYIHIPFCKQKCIYCNFYSVASQSFRRQYVDALLKEIDLQKHYLKDTVFQTVYFGGGTPSILDNEELQMIFEKLYSVFHIANDAEVTLEANPEHLSYEKLGDLKNYTPVNRLSIGIQSFSDEILKFLNRKHTEKQALDCIENASKIGFHNLTIDLIYGIPSLSNKEWERSLKLIGRGFIQHLSAYALTLETGTMLDIRVQKGLSQPPDEDKAIEQFKILLEKTSLYGFRQYEISNFAKSGFESKHNSNYWNASIYLGLGASAHSFNGVSRQWNVDNLQNYIELIGLEKPFYEKEILTNKDLFNEFIMLSLRKIEGIPKLRLNDFSEEYSSLFKKQVQPFLQKRLVCETADFYTLTEDGLLFADKIAAELFL